MHTTFIDTLPTTAILIPGSVVVNGVPSGSASNPLLIDLATVPPNTFGTITFSIVVNTVPTPLTIPNTSSLSYLYDSAGTTLANSKLSNLVTTTIISANLLSQKVVDKITASLGDTLTYTITFRNNGNTGINNLYFIDTIPQGTNYVPNTFTQDGSTIIGSPGTGLTLPNGVNPNSTTTIQFKVVIVSKPNPNPIPNSATGKGTFLIDPSTVPMLLGLATTTTTIVNTQVNYAALSIVKNVDKNYASCGDTLSYTISILNGGTTNATQVLFKDTLPQGTLLIPDSVRINGTIISGANLTVGVTLPDITADSSTTISFQVAVVC